MGLTNPFDLYPKPDYEYLSGLMKTKILDNSSISSFYEAFERMESEIVKLKETLYESDLKITGLKIALDESDRKAKRYYRNGIACTITFTFIGTFLGYWLGCMFPY